MVDTLFEEWGNLSSIYRGGNNQYIVGRKSGAAGMRKCGVVLSDVQSGTVSYSVAYCFCDGGGCAGRGKCDGMDVHAGI